MFLAIIENSGYKVCFNHIRGEIATIKGKGAYHHSGYNRFGFGSYMKVIDPNKKINQATIENVYLKSVGAERFKKPAEVTTQHGSWIAARLQTTSDIDDTAACHRWRIRKNLSLQKSILLNDRNLHAVPDFFQRHGINAGNMSVKLYSGKSVFGVSGKPVLKRLETPESIPPGSRSEWTSECVVYHCQQSHRARPGTTNSANDVFIRITGTGKKKTESG